MAYGIQPPLTFPPADAPSVEAVADHDLISALVTRKRKLMDKLEELPQCRPPQKVTRGMERLIEQCFRRGGPETPGNKSSAASAAVPSRISSADWDKQWSFDVNELRTRPREPKSGRGPKRKEVVEAVISTLATNEEESDEDAVDEVEETEEVLGDEEDEEEEPGDYTSSYFDNGEEEPDEESGRDDE